MAGNTNQGNQSTLDNSKANVSLTTVNEGSSIPGSTTNHLHSAGMTLAATATKGDHTEIIRHSTTLIKHTANSTYVISNTLDYFDYPCHITKNADDLRNCEK